MMHLDIGTKVRVTHGPHVGLTGVVKNHTHTGPAVDHENKRRFPDDQADLHLVDLDDPTEDSGPYQWFKPGEIVRA